MSTEPEHRAGTVVLLGRPNVGKSTLLNRVVGEKLAIVSPKPQTTRNRIVGVWNGPEAQVVFVDTPGVHAAKSELNRFMVKEAFGAMEEVDAVLLVVEAPEGPARAEGAPSAALRVGQTEERILARLAEQKKPTILAINKVDRTKDKGVLLPLLEGWQRRFPFAAMVPISAKTGGGIERLVKELIAVLPEGPPLYGEDMLTDRTERFFAAELIREQLFLKLHQELPYTTAVVIENWEERPHKGDLVIDALIVVERESQQGIVVGKGGAMIREIGSRARAEITQFLGRPAHVKLHVKVITDWTATPQGLARAGYQPT